jgi:hypothetical protein
MDGVILGLSSASFTVVHVLISLTAIGSGFVMMFGFLQKKRLAGWNAIFFTTSILTSMTGFMFPFDRVMPSHILALLSLVALTIASLAYNAFGFNGSSRLVYVVTFATALYLLCFAAVVQLFAKIPALRAVAPTRTEWPYLLAQSAVLALFVVLGYLAARRFAIAKLRTM